ncbi:MAG: AbrB/MazE/SpoVT family DNA-binding domain-containing protein [Lysobacterales bacterium]
MNTASIDNDHTLTVNQDGAIVVPASLVQNLRLRPGQHVDVVNDGLQLRLTRPEVHAFADWRDISHQLLDEDGNVT